PRRDRGRGAHGRHRGRDQVRRAAGRGRATGLPVRAGARLRRGPEGRRQLPRRRRPGAGRYRGPALRLRPGGGRHAGGQADAGAARARRSRRASGARAPLGRGAWHRQSDAGHRRGGEGVCDPGRDQPSDEGRLRRTQGARAMVTAERFAQGMTFDQYVKFVGTPENLKREGSFSMPRKDYSDFLRRRDGQTFQSIPIAAFYTKSFEHLYTYMEFPQIYRKDRVVSAIRAPKPGESKDDTAKRGLSDFFAFQQTPFFRLYAAAAV